MSSCNGCTLERMKKQYGEKLIKFDGSWYLKGEQPGPGQSRPKQLPDGTPIQFVAWFMSEGHDHSQSQFDIDSERFYDNPWDR